MSYIVQIPSSLKYIHVIEEYISTVRSDFQIDDSIYGNIHLAVVEAVTNAIIHGNKSDENKDVYFETKKEDTRIKFIVKDQGKGFDANKIPDPTLPENLEKLSGRGVFLIKNLADEVSFSEDGSTLQMVFHI
ncbi:MAG TPA: ATP-binding protein [Chitinophagales bacterium]|nr:ATP-binding protein [Chitinophagales bacterium]